MALKYNLRDSITFEVKVHSGHSESVSALSIIKLFGPEPLTTGSVSSSLFLTMIWTNIIFGLYFRTLVFYNVWKTGGLFGRPINILTGNFESVSFTYFAYTIFAFTTRINIDLCSKY